MSQSLGQLYVNLTAETGGFVSALSKAAYEAQKFSKDASRSFGELREVAEQTFGAFGEFNPIISKLSFALESAGSASAKMIKEFRDVGGVLGPIAALGAGAGAGLGLAAFGVGVIALAGDAAESAAKLYQLSQSTGVSVEALSRFQYAAKQTGTDTQAMVTGLERMSKSAFAAATAPAGAANAYTRLGVALRDSQGNLRSTESVLLDLAERFSKLPDGVAKTALAMQIFGRGGAALIPFLNEGKSGIQELIDQADRLGVTMSTTAAEAAEKFERELGVLRGAAEGAGNRLMEDLLPALTAVANASQQWLSDQRNVETLRALADGAAGAARFVLNLADAMIFAGRVTAAFWEATGKGGWTKPWEQLAPSTWSKFASDVKAAHDEMQKFAVGEFPEHAAIGAPPAQRALPPGFAAAAAAPTASGRLDVVAEMVQKLQAQAAAELALAAATEKSTTAILLAKAAGEAETRIAETRSRLLEQEKSLRAQLADANSSAAAGESSGGERAVKIQAEIGGIRKMLAELEKDAPQIKSLFAEIAAGEFGAKASKDLESFITKTTQETAALQEMTAAYALGPLAAQQAQQGAKIAPFEKQRSDLKALIDGLGELAAAEQKSSGTVGPSARFGEIAQLQKAYDELGGAIDRAKVSEAAFVSAEISEKIAKEKALLASEATGYRLVAAAALRSAADQRQAAAESAALKFGAEHPTATSSQLGEVQQTELTKLTQQRELTIAQEAKQFDLNAAYSQELEKLQEIKSFLESSGESTIAIDTQIYETRIAHIAEYQQRVFQAQNEELLGNAKLYGSWKQLIDQWDRAVADNPFSSLADRFRSMVNEIELAGENLGGKTFDVFNKGIDDASSQLAKFIVTGKANFKSLLDGIAEQLIKAQIQFGISKAFQAIFGGPQAPGAAGGPQQSGIGPGATAGTLRGPLGIGGALAGAFGIKLPGAPGAGAGLGPSSVATMNIVAQLVNLSGAPTSLLGGSPGISTEGGFPGFAPLASAADNGLGPGAAGSPAPAGSGFFGSVLKLFGLGSSVSGLGAPGGASTTAAAATMQAAATMMQSAASTMQAAATEMESSSAESSTGGGSGGLFGGLLSLFSGGGESDFSDMDLGGFADIAAFSTGGRVTKGVPYIVGEDRPEVFVPQEHGRIVRSIPDFTNSSAGRAMAAGSKAFDLSGIARRESGGSVSAGIPYLAGESRPEVFMPDSAINASAHSRGSDRSAGSAVYHTQLILPGVVDYDSFKRSQGQIYAELQQQLGIAHYRNRGGG
jgi:hypothetical protein